MFTSQNKHLFSFLQSSRKLCGFRKDCLVKNGTQNLRNPNICRMRYCAVGIFGWVVSYFIFKFYTVLEILCWIWPWFCSLYLMITGLLCALRSMIILPSTGRIKDFWGCCIRACKPFKPNSSVWNIQPM